MVARADRARFARPSDLALSLARPPGDLASRAGCQDGPARRAGRGARLETDPSGGGRAMTLLLSPVALRHRRDVARGALAPLADGLRRELQPLIAARIEVPTEKALLS